MKATNTNTPAQDTLPWIRLMEIAYGVLKLSPKTFWEMTPCEWIVSLKGWQESQGIVTPEDMFMTRAELGKLIEKFPDITRSCIP